MECAVINTGDFEVRGEVNTLTTLVWVGAGGGIVHETFVTHCYQVRAVEGFDVG